MSEDGGATSNKLEGGNFSAPVVQGRDFTNTTFVLQQAAAAPVALAQLPPLAAGFTGREAQLAQMVTLLDPAGAAGVVVSAVVGLAGVGKTALAVQAGHAALSSGWFPGGVLFIDLRGYDSSPVRPDQGLDSLLRALGVAGEHIPEGTAARAGLYRSTLAQVTDPVLVIADNASSEAQVRPLLPGPGPHRVIITSRHTLAGLGARLLDVPVLDQAAALRLLDTVVRMARPGDDRVSGDPVAAGRLAEVCGGLPLALLINAARLAADPVLAAEELADALDDKVRLQETLQYDDGSGTGMPSVAAAFELSYRHLNPDAARLFRILSAAPGPDVSTAAAAEMSGWPTERARVVISGLIQAHMIEPSGTRGRWRMHDLLRAYAREIPGDEADEREQAFDRILAWYLRYARAADQHLQGLSGTPTSASKDDALAWLDAERPGLISAVMMAADGGRHREAMLLSFSLEAYLSWRRRFDDWLTVAAASRDCARRLNDRVLEAAALTSLGNALAELRRFKEAATAHQRATEIFRKVGDRRVGAMALSNLGSELVELRRFGEAITAHQDAATILRETGDRHAEGTALNNLGLALREVRRFEEAVNAHQDAVAIYRETGDRYRQATALNNLGIALVDLRRCEEAVAAHQDAAEIFGENGDRHGEGLALNNLGTALLEAQRFEEAIVAHQDAVAIYRETGDRYREGTALNNLGLALREVRRFEEAIVAHQDAVAIYQETSERYHEGNALNNLGIALVNMQRFEDAVTAHQVAVAIYREIGDRHSEGNALNNLGLTLRKVRRFEEAVTAHQDAAAIYRETGDLYRAGLALNNLGTALLEVRRFEEANIAKEDASTIYPKTGD